MSRPKPQKIVVEFDDGSKTEATFDALPNQLQFELLRQPFASQPSSDPEHEKFVLLEWQDGWKEVIEVDSTCQEINRYYVISRREDVGRLSLNKEDSYPELIEIIRKPLNLKKITFLDTFRITLQKSNKEGKKIDHYFALDKDGDTLPEIINDFKKAVVDEEIDLQKLGSQNAGQLRKQYERIRRKIGIKAGRRQQDVFDFIAYLIKSSVPM